MKISHIVALSLGLACATSGTVTCAARTSAKPMSETSINPFTQSLQIASQRRASMNSQFLDLGPAIDPAFRGKSIQDVAAALAEVLKLDAGVRPSKLDAVAVTEELNFGHPVALGFNAAQIRAITGSDAGMHKDDLVLIILSTDPNSRHVKLDRATLRNTTLFP